MTTTPVAPTPVGNADDDCPDGGVGGRSAGGSSSGDAPPGRLALAGLLIVAGVLHFVVPRFYEQIVPRWAGNARFHVMWSGAAEVVSGLLLLVPPTRRAGAWLALVTLVLVYPANVQMAIDTGRPKDLMGVAVWLRLPLQLPMWRAAWRHTR